MTSRILWQKKFTAALLALILALGSGPCAAAYAAVPQEASAFQAAEADLRSASVRTIYTESSGKMASGGPSPANRKASPQGVLPEAKPLGVAEAEKTVRMSAQSAQEQLRYDRQAVSLQNAGPAANEGLYMSYRTLVLCAALIAVLLLSLVFMRTKYARRLKEQNKILAKRYEEELACRSALQGDQIIASIKANLTTATVEETQPGYRFAGIRDLNELVEQIITTIPAAQDKEMFRSLFAAEQMKKSFADGKTGEKLVYKRLQPTGELIWVESSARLLQRPDSEEITLFFYTRTIQNEMLMKSIINTLILNDYEALFYIDIQSDFAQLFPGKNGQSSIRQIPNFEKTFLDWLYSHKKQTAPRDLLQSLAMKNVQKALEQAEIFQYVAPLRWKGKDSIRMRLRFSYIDKENQLLCLACDDVTHLYEAEQQQTQRLREALEQAQMHAQAKSEFLSRMSHEMRTPMNAIMGLTDLARQEAQALPAVVEYLDKISGASGYLLNLINDILDMARMEHGKLQFQDSAFRFDRMLMPMLEIIETQATKKKVRLHVASVLEEEWFRGDKVRLQQVLINLLGNAVKFTPSGGQVRLDITDCAPAQGPHQVTFLIADTGIGISPEFLKIMFEPFAQEHVGATSRYRGTGLGLPISKNIVELMGGTIEAESEKGKGTLFTVTLPMVAVNKAEPEKQTPLSAPGAELKDKRILLAEDHPLNIEITTKLLKSKGAEVTVAQDGQQALERFAASAPGWYDAVLMDIRMPVLDGYGATAALRRMERPDAARVPIIAMTANAFQEDIDRAFAAGMDRHLSKPIVPELLFRTLEEQICRYRTEDLPPVAENGAEQL